MLAEKKIRIINQLQLTECHQAQLDIQTNCDVSSSLLSNDIEWLASQLSIPEECDLTAISSDLVYYVAGSIGRSVGWVKKCTDCNTLLVDRHIDTMVELICDEECAATRHCLHTVEEKDGLLDLVNRSGLAHPTNYCYAVCKTIFLLYTDIKENDKLHTEFLLKQHNCEIFVRACEDKCNEIYDLSCLTKTKCLKGHAVFLLIARKMFNTFLHNILKRLNVEYCTSANTDSVKIRKLQNN